MRDENVHHLPLRGDRARTEVRPLHPEPKQLDLFEHAYGALRVISYLDIAALEQEQLIRSLVKNAVTTIIDLRSVPVFPKPRFDHRYLMSYFYERSVNYIEFAMVEKLPTAHICARESLDNWLASSRRFGVTACITDDAAIREGVVASFRKGMAKAVDAFIEVHPRALI